MKSGIIFYFFFLHSLGMSKVCGSLYNPNNFTSVPQMEGDGWVFSVNSWPCSPTHAQSTWEQSTYCKCYGPGKSYCGYVPGLDNGVVGSKELTLSLGLNLNGWKAGRLTIDYGSAGSTWKVGLYLNGVLVDETCQDSKIFEMDFNDGDELMVVEWGVLLLHSIEFTCCGELVTSDSSDSYSSDILVDRAYNSSTLYSSGDSIVPTTLLLIVTSIVILATVFLCMQLIYKAMTQINWQVSVEPLEPVDKVEIQTEGFSDEPNVPEKQLQTSVLTGEPSEEGININYV